MKQEMRMELNLFLDPIEDAHTDAGETQTDRQIVSERSATKPPMRSAAFFSDVHGNLEALEAVLDDINRRGYETLFCLGDIVGYGPDPVKCLDIVRRRCTAVVRGNHDQAVVNEPVGFNRIARQSVEWTKKQLAPRLSRRRSRERWAFLRQLPASYQWEGLLLVHGSPRDPVREYILPEHAASPPPGMFEEIFAAFETTCMVGHTHIPGVFEERPTRSSQNPDSRFQVGQETGPCFIPEAEDSGSFHYQGRKMIMNVGSVGQPRDDDWRSCYVGFDGNGFSFHRVDYPVEITKRKIEACSGLDNSLADRLGGLIGSW